MSESAALVTINASTIERRHQSAVVFTGTVNPSHPFERVLLQQQNGAGELEHAATAATRAPARAIRSRTPAFPGERDVRVVLPR